MHPGFTWMKVTVIKGELSSEYEKNGLSMSKIAEMLKISKTLVWNIIHNKQ